MMTNRPAKLPAVLTTDEAAAALNRKPQTLRKWASTGQQGALRPLRINGRLAWPLADIQALLTRGTL